MPRATVAVAGHTGPAREDCPFHFVHFGPKETSKRNAHDNMYRRTQSETEEDVKEARARGGGGGEGGKGGRGTYLGVHRRHRRFRLYIPFRATSYFFKKPD